MLKLIELDFTVPPGEKNIKEVEESRVLRNEREI